MFDLKEFDYCLPDELVAQKPAVPRDSSRLFVYNTVTDDIIFDRFDNLVKYLPRNSFLVLNKTKVLPARVILKNQRGGKVVCLLLINEILPDVKTLKSKKGLHVIKAMVDRKVCVGDKLFIDKKYFFEAVKQEKNIFYLQFEFDFQWLLDRLVEIGKTPVPLYLRKTPLTEVELREKYQTVFVNKMRGVEARPPDGCRNIIGSVAAPTASLHFSNKVFKSLDEYAIKRLFVRLHVGMGTFAPITNNNLKNKKLHEEYYEVDRQTLQSINKLKSEGKKLVAAGTTVVRTLESIKNLEFRTQSSKFKHSKNKQILNSKLNSELLIMNSEFIKKTDLFIMSPYDFKMVDYLITNFHLPKSSLMMLVEAFLQHKKAKKKLVDLYQIAIREKFRFYSFGDAMLIV